MNEEERATSRRYGYGEQANQAQLLASALAKLNKPKEKPVVLGPPSPAYAGVIERATARGLTPTKTGIQATLEKNARAAQSGDDRTVRRLESMTAAARLQAASTALMAIQLATLARKDFAPKVTVNNNVGFTITVRDTQVKTKVYNTYNAPSYNTREVRT